MLALLIDYLIFEIIYQSPCPPSELIRFIVFSTFPLPTFTYEAKLNARSTLLIILSKSLLIFKSIHLSSALNRKKPSNDLYSSYLL